MKQIIPFFLAIMIIVGCTKDTPTSSCSFFPIYNGKQITYTWANKGNLTASQIKWYDIVVTSQETVITIDQCRFTLSSCDSGIVLLTMSGMFTNAPIFDSTQSISTTKVIYSDGSYSITQYKDYAGNLFSNIRKKGTSNDMLRTTFYSGIGIKSVDFINYTNGNTSKSYILK